MLGESMEEVLPANRVRVVITALLIVCGSCFAASETHSQGAAPTPLTTVDNSQVSTLSPHALQASLSNGLVAAYPLNGNALDLSGHGHNGVLTANVIPAEDRFGVKNGALRFTGTSSYVRVPDFPHYNTFAACVWVKAAAPSPLDRNQNIISKHGNTSDIEVLVQRSRNGKYGMEWTIGGGFTVFDTDGVGVIEPSYTNWDFLVAQYNGSAMQFFVNGQLVREQTMSGAIATSSQELTFGAYAANPNVCNFVGQMDDIRFYNRTLTPAEIQHLFLATPQQCSFAAAAVNTPPPVSAPNWVARSEPVPAPRPVLPPPVTTPKLVSYKYNDKISKGVLSVDITNQGMEGRDWVIKNIGKIASSKELLLEAGNEPTTGGRYKVLNESLDDGILTVEFEVLH